ncbi:class I SAM-dependent methyltransferase [Mycobacterium vicinigordonae]|uniref:Class I SAM-dependent methyltransferase n=1 Tax=Mycobacterium vicinigordonae TaxID=1719132 RepID=A0A7D6DXG8_9MYCO|nr:class I SAM-dependent methyltransferase [Mycobacterium vicinigordonae]QLL07204.1 class I SAM-dependent methyltransferase [Mycobacterium vicinigordonae]
MIAHVAIDIERMPRGGPGASRLDRWLETDRLEYIDRADVERRKRAAIRSLDRMGRLFGFHNTIARVVLDEIPAVPAPRILELGAGHGGLSRTLLAMHANAQLTITDIDTSLVASIGAGDLGSHPRATVCAMDATAIDLPDDSYDLAVFSLSLHHLPPTAASKVFAEGTRVARKLVIVDLPRAAPPLHLVRLALVMPWMMFPWSHDGVISSLRSYSPSALLALAQHADPGIDVSLRGGRVFHSSRRPLPQIAVAAAKPGRLRSAW